MEKKIWLVFIILSSLLIVSCRPGVPAGEYPQETAAILKAVQTGTQGLEIRFIPNYPPYQIYDVQGLQALVELRNLGRHNLEPQNCYLELGGYDPSIIRGINYRQPCPKLEGKNPFNLQGGIDQVEFSSSSIFLPTNTLVYRTNLLAQACYGYKTQAQFQVCVDPLWVSTADVQKACQVLRNLPVGGGQAAPVGIASIRQDSMNNKVLFTIEISNFGKGRVFSPLTSLLQCPRNIYYNEWDKIIYSVNLQGGSLESCKPADGIVKMFNNKGIITCTFNLASQPAFETILNVELSYNYLDSVPFSIEILKSP